MDPIVYYPTIILALLLIPFSLYRRKKFNQPIELTNLVNLVLLSSGIVGGGLLLLSALYEPVTKRLSDIKLYIFIGGIAVLYVSIKGVVSEFVKPKDGDDAK